MSGDRVETEIDGRTLSLSNLEKVLYPKTGFTKGEMIHYYAQIAEVMLPHIKDRPMTLKRYVHGVDGAFFFEKHVPAHRPKWTKSVMVPHGVSSPSPDADQPDIEYLVINDRPTLLWAANLASVEFHVPMWRAGNGRKIPGNADHMVFDLDPGPGTHIAHCSRVARWITERLGDAPLFAKTSGSKGLQLYLPLKGTAAVSVSERAHEIARAVEVDHPDAVVSTMRKELRFGRVLIDWSQNSPAKTTVAAYSLRARPEPTVSTPVTWDEIDACARSDEPGDLRFEPADVFSRVAKFGDLMGRLVTPAVGRVPSTG